MKLVITGALGHIGSGLIRFLKPGRFSEVVLLDNLLTQRYGSLFRLPEGVPFRFVEADILDPGLEKHFEGACAVIHLAAITTAEASFDLRDQVEKVNLEGTRKVASACAKTGSRLFFPSTTSVYATAGGMVTEEDGGAVNPQSPYAESKLRGEELLRELRAREGLRFCIGRLGTIFGVSPGMRFHTAVNKFAWQACNGNPLTVWRTALNQRRPYLDLSDAVRALLFLLEEDLFDGETYNIVTVNATVADVLEILRRHLPDLAVGLLDSRAMNDLSYDVSSEKILRTGFAFAGSLEKGIGDTVALLRNVRGV